MQVAALIAGMDLRRGRPPAARAAEAPRRRASRRCARASSTGAGENGIERADAERVWELVANFASFAFCKAHAVTYGRIAYRAAWLKTHHPAAFLAAFLQSETGYYEPRVYVEEARRLGVADARPRREPQRRDLRAGVGRRTARPACASGWARSRGSRRRRSSACSPRARRRAVPVAARPARAHGARTSTRPRRLIGCGALDAFDRTRPELAWRLHLLRGPARRAPRERGRRRAGARARPRPARGLPRDAPRARRGDARRRARARRRLADADLSLGRRPARRPARAPPCSPSPRPPAWCCPGLPDLDARERGLLEIELLGFPLREHPVRLLPCAADERLVARFGGPRGPESRRGELRPVNPRPCADRARRPGARLTLRGWLAATRRVRTEAGEWMRFLTLEDESGLAEVVLFPDVYQRDGGLLVDRGAALHHRRGRGPAGGLHPARRAHLVRPCGAQEPRALPSAHPGLLDSGGHGADPRSRRPRLRPRRAACRAATGPAAARRPGALRGHLRHQPAHARARRATCSAWTARGRAGSGRPCGRPARASAWRSRCCRRCRGSPTWSSAPTRCCRCRPRRRPTARARSCPPTWPASNAAPRCRTW